MASKVSSIRIPDDVIAQYDAVARATGRSRNTLMVEALRAAIATESWFVAAVERGVAAANAGEFVPDEDIEALWDELCR
jgi:predicted transcriptional regulator